MRVFSDRFESSHGGGADGEGVSEQQWGGGNREGWGNRGGGDGEGGVVQQWGGGNSGGGKQWGVFNHYEPPFTP